MELKTFEVCLPIRYADLLLHDNRDGLTPTEVEAVITYITEFHPEGWCIAFQELPGTETATFVYSYKNQ
jgi:hypothetical protein